MGTKKYELSQNDLIRVADTIAGRVILMDMDQEYHQKMCNKYRTKITKQYKTILAGNIPWILSLPKAKQEMGISIASLYMLVYHEPDMAKELRKSSTVNYLWEESKSFFDAVIFSVKNGASVKEMIAKNQANLNLYTVLIPAILEKCYEPFVEGWEGIRDSYFKAVLRMVKPINTRFTEEERREFLTGTKIAGKEKTLLGYDNLWNSTREKWLYRQPDCWDTNSLVNPFNVLMNLSLKTGCGIFGKGYSGLISKQDNQDIISALLSEHERNDVDVEIGEEDARGKKEVPDNRPIVVPHNFDTLFCFSAVIDTLMRNNVELQKERLRQIIEKKMTDSSYVRKIEAENDSLHAELDALNARIKRLEKSNKELYEKYASSQNRIDALKTRRAGEEQKATIKASAPEPPVEEPAPEPEAPIIPAPEPVIELTEEEISDELDRIFNEHKIVLAGGNANLINKFTSKHPDVCILDKNRIASCDLLVRNASAILFKTDSMSHTLYRKCKQIATSAGIPICYVPETASVPKMEHAIYDLLSDFRKKED